MKKIVTDPIQVNEKIKEFMIDYFEKMPFEYWENRLKYIEQKLLSKIEDSEKAYYIIDLQSFYMQLLEVFFINILILSARESGLMGIMFMNNADLILEIKKYFNDDNYIDWFLDNLVFGIKEKKDIEQYEDCRRDYSIILKESVDDYIKNRDFLNSFKHGFRIQAKFGVTNTYVNEFPILATNSSVQYYTKEKNIVYENSILFNFERIVTRCYFLITMVNSSKNVFLAQEKKLLAVSLDNALIKDREIFLKSFGSFCNKKPLFVLKQKGK